MLLDPMKRGNSGVAIKRMQFYLSGIMLRRTKDTKIDGKPIFTLPPRNVNVVKTDFYDPEERIFYDKIQAKGVGTIGKYEKAGTIMNNITSILTASLRMRQACAHPHISEPKFSRGTQLGRLMAFAVRDSTTKSDKEGIVAKQPKTLDEKDSDDIDDLVGSLGNLGLEEGCATCQVSFKVKRRSKGRERFCVGCAEEMNPLDDTKYSTKIRQLMDKLNEIRDEDPTRKTIVFSQFTSMLALIKPFLKEGNFKFVECVYCSVLLIWLGVDEYLQTTALCE